MFIIGVRIEAASVGRPNENRVNVRPRLNIYMSPCRVGPKKLRCQFGLVLIAIRNMACVYTHTHNHQPDQMHMMCIN